MEISGAGEIILIVSLFVVAILYSSVGHGGASGYLAVMAFLSVSPTVTRPTALILNLFVASIGAFQFYRRGYFDRKVFLSFAATSIPFAFLGGMIHLPFNIYRLVLGFVLLFAAFRLAWNFSPDKEIAAPKLWIALVVGALIGLLSGLVGVGGGIFLNAGFAAYELDGSANCRRNFGNVYSRQFRRRTSGKLRAGFRVAIERRFLDNRRRFRWYNRFDTRQPLFQYADFAKSSGSCFGVGGGEIDFYLN